MHSWRGIALVLALLVGATACGGGATGVVNPCAPTSGSVVGCVTDSPGGSAGAGATITASPAGTTTTTGTATTDSQGRYALSLSPETYDIVATKPGKAASKFQSVIVKSGQTTTANLIMPNVFDPDINHESQQTMQVTRLIAAKEVVGIMTFAVSVTAVSNPVRRID